MRTTLTIEDDVAKRLADEQQKRGVSFKDTVNADGDFARVPGLKWRNPLAPTAAR